MGMASLVYGFFLVPRYTGIQGANQTSVLSPGSHLKTGVSLITQIRTPNSLLLDSACPYSQPEPPNEYLGNSCHKKTLPCRCWRAWEITLSEASEESHQLQDPRSPRRPTLHCPRHLRSLILQMSSEPRVNKAASNLPTHLSLPAHPDTQVLTGQGNNS